jgi:amino-acid N-acetyltransferase
MSLQEKRNHTESITFDFASPSDESQIRNLLSRFNLPFEDIREHLSHFIIARKEDKIIGCVGLEAHGPYGLVRSLAVAEEYRGMGIARILCARLMENASKLSIDNLYLLTETAAGFFEKLGYYRVDRNEAPDAIKSTREFTLLCPSTASFMTNHKNSNSRGKLSKG